MLSKFAELADVEVTLRHTMHLFMPTFYCDTMLKICHRGSKSLVVRMDHKGSRQFWLDFFFVKTETIMTDAVDFSDA